MIEWARDRAVRESFSGRFSDATQVAVWQCGGSARSWSTWASSADEQLEQLLEEQQQRPGRRLGKVAEDLGYVTDEQLAQALAEQWGMQVIHLADIVVPPQVLGYVTEPMAQLYRIVPVSFRDGTLTIAVCDPQNLTVQDELRTFLGYEIRAVVATERDIAAALDRYYSAGDESVESLVADMESDKELAKLAEMVNRDGPIELGNFEAAADSAPVRKLLNMVLLLAIKDQASDLHFEPFEDEFRIRIKADGVLYEMVPPPRHLAFAITTRIKVMAKLDIAERRVPQDGRIELSIGGHPVDLRVSVLPTMFGESVVMRVLDRSVVSLDLNKVGMDQPTLKTVPHRHAQAQRHHPGDRADRVGQDHHALLRLERNERRQGKADHDRRPRRVRHRRHRAGAKSMPRSATRSPLACGRFCGRIPTGFWSARFATPRRPKSPCRPR